jgi:hypothetical protein
MRPTRLAWRISGGRCQIQAASALLLIACICTLVLPPSARIFPAHSFLPGPGQAPQQAPQRRRRRRPGSHTRESPRIHITSCCSCFPLGREFWMANVSPATTLQLQLKFFINISMDVDEAGSGEARAPESFMRRFRRKKEQDDRPPVHTPEVLVPCLFLHTQIDHFLFTN